MSEIFSSRLEWTGCQYGPTLDPDTFSRDLSVQVDGQQLAMSSAPAFHGNEARINPEQLFVAAISACQALTYLSLAARRHVTVVSYVDEAEGSLEKVDGVMQMSRVVLRPRIVLSLDADERAAADLIERAHRHCFIGNSVKAQVTIEPVIERARLAAAS
jgi:organic hydroperoxide reductase OsmC/OhrA